MALKESSVAQISDLLGGTKNEEPKACLLIGAGVSYTAGIGLANDFIHRIEAEYPAIYKAACQKCGDGRLPTYAECMAQLPPATQVKLVRTDIDAAKTNWAHIGIARMEREGVIDTILTPNFDPLASRACALFNRFPAIYDLAGLRDEAENNISFDKSFVKGSAIFHLHGQHTGFLLLNTEEKLQSQAKRIRPVLDAVMKGKPVIIAGYSGENDPLIDQIAELAPFNHGLFWICRDDTDPAENVIKKLLSLENCYVVRNMPSDKFFTQLANALKLEPPGFLATPFDHMLQVLDTLRPYADIHLSSSAEDLLEKARKQLADAASTQSTERPERANLTLLMSSGRYEEVWQQYYSKADDLDREDKDLVAWAAIEIADKFSEQAGLKHGEAADLLYMQATEKYESALNINPEMHEALNNWGVSLTEQAKKKDGEEAKDLLSKACSKFASAIKIKPDKVESLNNWGAALAEQSQKSIGEDATALFDQACEKYAEALKIDPETHEVLNNWGTALSERAKERPIGEAKHLYAQACEKYEKSLQIKPDKHEALNNWGNALSDFADITSGEESDKLFAEACEKYAKAVSIRPDMSEALSNWGATLIERASSKTNTEADALLDEAKEKFSAALDARPDNYGALGFWGNALADQARKSEGADADKLFEEANIKFASALAINPNLAGVLNDWGAAIADRANTKEGEFANYLYAEAHDKFDASLALRPDSFRTLTNIGAAFLDQAKRVSDEGASELLEKAEAHLLEAENMSPGVSAYNLACLHALKGEVGLAVEWLKKSKDYPRNFPGCAHIHDDQDFDLVKDSAQFKEALLDIGC